MQSNSLKPLQILYQTKNFAVINKPSGYIVQGTPKGREGENIRVLLRTLPPPSIDPQRSWRWGPLHRLDRLTTGCLALGAIDQENRMDYRGTKFQSAQAQAHGGVDESKITKEYLAIVRDTEIGSRKKWSGSSYARIGLHKDPAQPKVRLVTRNDYVTTKIRRQAVQQANLDWQVVATNKNEDIAMMLLKPKEGRKHQVRIQCAQQLKTPILGDYLYGKEKQSSFMYLHCWKLSFPRWIKEEDGRATRVVETVTAPLSHEWLDFMNLMKKTFIEGFEIPEVQDQAPENVVAMDEINRK